MENNNIDLNQWSTSVTISYLNKLISKFKKIQFDNSEWLILRIYEEGNKLDNIEI